MKSFHYYLTHNDTRSQAVLSFLYENLWSLVQVWGNSAAGARPMMTACLSRMPAEMQQDRVSDFLFKTFPSGTKYEQCVAAEPVIAEVMTWSMTDSKFDNFGTNSGARFYVYRAFVNYCADEWKKMQRENSTEPQEMTKMIDCITNEQYDEALAYMINNFSADEKVIAFWRMGMLTEEQALERIGCSRRTLYSRFKTLKKNHMGGAA